ncbi:FAD-dependent oxidoreductase [Mycolicibacillus parakoreensis]|uniref:FAD-dependent oxidoreductase n=1 Tax=Mycolicibacillus parakoreensis TaxID=1069221 RepID=A0ABY3U117_9MYCO|nr:FAD-dependent oxidoreductase [Mycolicibacillus parakoreensis]MCV7314972.1 FAD-dependent oxidoreductase [Mycolicibacillus parakoreensis]ULN53660.2 FAD-dependent oxidoreductase [Mycolicibacillus parakoreensis]
MSERLVVVGGDAAGMSAASQARRRRGADDLAITVFERGNYTSYSACGIPYFVGGVVEELDSLIARSPETFRRKLSIDARLGHDVTEIDVDRRAVRVRDHTGEHWEGFDQLVIATGAVPVRPAIDGVDAAGIYGVQTLDDGLAVRDALDDGRPRTAVVVGAGYIGLEMAEALVQRGLQVSVVERSPQPMSTLDPDMGAPLAEALQSIGITLYLGESVVGFETRGGHVRAVRTEARTLPADLVVLGLGTRPNAALAQDAGIPTGVTGGIVTDRRMRTGVDGIWAAGDCVETVHRVSGRAVHIALGTHANKQGRVAGINIGGGYATFPGVLGTAVTKICGIEVARTGLGEREAEQAGFAYQVTVVDSTTRAGYYPGAAPIKTKLIAEQRSGRLLGAQIVGEENAAKRIDALAVALWNQMTVEEMSGLDLSYAPPFSPVWDPVLIAARKAAESIEATAAGRQ